MVYFFKKKPVLYFFISSILILCLFFKNIHKADNVNKKIQIAHISDSQISSDTISSITKNDQKVAVFDLNQVALEDDEHIRCRKSKKIFVETTLCVHDTQNDIFVSKDIWNNGVWEPNTVEAFNEILSKNPDYLVLDVGAQVGQYSLYAAKMGHNVITVEPFYDNILRLHKAARIEKFQDKITLIRNAISNKAGEIKMLYRNQKNIGGQGIIKNQRIDPSEANLKNKYLVKTIVFDDLADHLPTKLKTNKVIMKLDIEGYEPMAFENAERLFSVLDFQVIFMEWGNLPPQKDIQDKIENMIDFLYKHQLLPHSDRHEVLEKNNWQKWPWDIIWYKNLTKV